MHIFAMFLIILGALEMIIGIHGFKNKTQIDHKSGLIMYATIALFMFGWALSILNR